MLALPGSAYMYQGEELGLPEVVDIPVDWLRGPAGDPVRRPHEGPRRLPGAAAVDAAAGATYGFGPAGSTASWLPAPASWGALSVEAESGDPGSMLELYRSALTLRRALPELGAETDDTALVWLPAPEGVLAFRRGDGFVCTVNTGSSPVSLPVPGALLLASADVPVTG